ncbi:RNA polymerase sigma factor [Ramlibacter ginsenosidimutans]|nr:sigma-70 family RNA polymerase sigma factor [Ramlibacter ginsenosidimutans]
MRLSPEGRVGDGRLWRESRGRYRNFWRPASAMLFSVDSSAKVSADGPEVELARRIASAAPDACEAEAELYRLLAPRVRRYGLRHLRDAHAAADLVQQVLTFAIERLRAGALREPERVLSFVLGTCRMTIMDERRAELRRADLLERYAEAVPQADAHVAPRLDERRVADCLERLPERERSVLVLTFYEDQPSDTVGAQLGLSPGNVRVIRHRGLDKLRRCVDAGKSRA